MASRPTIKRLAEIRSALETAQAALARLPERPLPASEAIERASAWIDAKAAEFGASRRAEAFAQAAPGLALERALAIDAEEVRPHQFAADTAPLVAWLLGDQLKAKLEAEISALELTDPLPAAKRAAEQQRLETEILNLEIEEEQITRALELAGEPIERRADCNLAVILAPDDELAGTTPLEHAA
jgi:hypothetical protein